MQKLIIAGNCGKDAELRNTQGGEMVLSFSLAVSNGKDQSGQDRPATWYDAAIWGKRADSLAPHIKKGDKLTLIGRPSVRVHDGKAYLGITVDDLTFMGSANREPAERVVSADDYRHKRGASPAPAMSMEDDIPFLAEWR